MSQNDNGMNIESSPVPSSQYKLREGIILKTICGEYVLVASGEARHHCPYVQQLNESAAYLWKFLEQGLDMNQMAARAAEDYSLSVEEIMPGLQDFIHMLLDQGYLYKTVSEGFEIEDNHMNQKK